MVGLAAGADLGFLHFDEVANVHAVVERRFGPDAAERADHAGGADFGAFNDAIGLDVGASADLHLAQHAVGADAHAIAQLHRAFEQHVDVQHHVASAADGAAHVEPLGIDNGDARKHEFARTQPAVFALERGELQLVVHAQHLGDGGRDQRRDLDLVLDGHRDDVGEVILALRVAVTELPKPALEELGFHRQHAGIAFADPALARAGIVLFDHAQYLALGVAHDSAITGGVGKLRREQAHALGACEFEQRLQRLGSDQRHVAVEHQHQVAVGHARQRLLHCMPGAKLLALQHPAQGRRAHRGTYAFAAVAVDDMDERRLECARGVEHMREQRVAGERLQHLRQVGAHPLALARGEDDYGKRPGFGGLSRHAGANLTQRAGPERARRQGRAEPRAAPSF